MAFSATYDVPQGYTLVEAGLLLGNVTKVDEEDLILNSANTSVKQYKSPISTSSGVITGHLDFGKPDTTYYCKAYLIVKDSNGTVLEPIFSTTTQGSYNSMNNDSSNGG